MLMWMPFWGCPGPCVPNALGTQHQITAAVEQAMQEAALKSPMSPTEAYSCNLHVMNLVEDSPQVTCMTAKDWQQPQLADPILGRVIVKMQDGTLGQCPYKSTNPAKIWQFL